MANQLVVVDDSKSPTGGHVVVEDYDEHPRPCRRGLWIGWKETFSQRVTLAFERPGHPYVGWSLNGVTVIDPGSGPFPRPPGEPCPGQPSVLYFAPVGGLENQIQFTGAPGIPRVCLGVQALYREHGNLPALVAGPSTTVCLSGADIEWPAFLVKEEIACQKRWWEILRRYVEVADVGPLDPVAFLGELPDQDLKVLHAAAQTLERITGEDQPELANAIRERVVGILRSRMVGAPGASDPLS
jgi:hypothetical protein